MNAAATLRNEIVEAAHARGLHTQRQLAKVLGISPQYLNDILKRSDRKMPPDIVIKAIQKLRVMPAIACRWHILGAIESGWKLELPAA